MSTKTAQKYVQNYTKLYKIIKDSLFLFSLQASLEHSGTFMMGLFCEKS